MREFRVKDNNNQILMKKGEELVHQFESCIETMLTTYSSQFNKEEEQLLVDSLRQIKTYLNFPFSTMEDRLLNLKNLLSLEDLLKPFVLRCWEMDCAKGIQIISWLKDDQYRKKERVISASLKTDYNFNVFCDGIIGISYDVSFSSYLGALFKDAAVIVSNQEKSLYTLIETEDYIVDSYSMATPLITPYEITRNIPEGKYCEIVLDARYAVPKNVVYFREEDYDMAESLSKKLGLPIQNLNAKEKK